MPKRPRFIHAVRHVRTCLGHTQASFAKLLGCSTITVQRIENGSLRLSRKLANTIFETTGANSSALLNGKALGMDKKPFSKTSTKDFRDLLSCIDNSKQNRQAIHSWIELLFIAAERAGQSKSDALVVALQTSLKKMCADFNLEKNIYGFLRENGSLRKRTYRVKDLRKFPSYAKIIGFVDNKRFKPDKILNFEIPHGWIPDFALLHESPVLPKELERKYSKAHYLFDVDQPIPKEIQDDYSKAMFWRIKKFQLDW